MSVYVMTPEVLKNEIDELAKEKGFKFFIISSEKDGTALAPSKKVPLYRIPVAVPEIFPEGKSSLGAMMQGFYFVGFKGSSDFNEETQKVCEDAVKRDEEETRNAGKRT